MYILEFGGNHNIRMKDVFYFYGKNKTNVLDIGPYSSN